MYTNPAALLMMVLMRAPNCFVFLVLTLFIPCYTAQEASRFIEEAAVIWDIKICRCFALLLCDDIHSGLPTVFLVDPEPVNATLNTTAVFHCIATGRSLLWFVDGQRQDTSEAMARGIAVSSTAYLDGITNSTLTIPATMDNDNITIYCEVGGDNGFFNSPEVLLRVQGMYTRVPV